MSFHWRGFYRILNEKFAFSKKSIESFNLYAVEVNRIHTLNLSSGYFHNLPTDSFALTNLLRWLVPNVGDKAWDRSPKWGRIETNMTVSQGRDA